MTDRATLGGPATQIVTNYYDAENRWVGRAVDPDGDTGTAAIHLTTFAYAGNQIIFQFDGTAETFPAPLGAEGEGLASSPRPLAGEGSGGEGSQNQTGFSTPLTAQNLSHRYLWADAVDQLLADEQLEATASGYDLTTPGNVVLPLTDQLGTVRDLAVCENGVTSVANHRVYDSYGNLQSETNAAVDCVFGFTGRPWDEATGLQNNLNRWYDPTVGRWLSEDPVGFGAGQANTSVYCGNEPVNCSDPSGLIRRDLVGGRNIDLRNGTFEFRWKFTLDQPYDFDVVIVQLFSAERVEVNPRTNNMTHHTVRYFEVIGTIPAGAVQIPDQEYDDVWSGPINEGVIVEAQVRVFRADDPDVNDEISGWPRFEVFAAVIRTKAPWTPTTPGYLQASQIVRNEWWNARYLEIETIDKAIVFHSESFKKKRITTSNPNPKPRSEWYPPNLK